MADPTDYWSHLASVPSPLASLFSGATGAREQQSQQLTLQNQQLAAQQAQRQDAAQQAQAARQAAALQTMLAKPNPTNIANYQMIAPEHAAQIKDAFDTLHTEAQDGELKYAANLNGLLTAGDTEGAKAAVQHRIDADKAAGIDTADEEHALDLLSNGGAKGAQTVLGLTRLGLASVNGPSTVVPNMASQATQAREDALQPGVLAAQQAAAAQAAATLAKTQADTNQITNPRPETASAGIGPNGQPIFFNKNAPPPETASPGAATQNNAAMGDFVSQLIGSESGGNANAQSSTSSASGSGQFLKGTWIPLISQLHPELTQGKTEAQILALRSDPKLNVEAATAYAQQNADTLQQAGLPVNRATVAMAHKLGPDGAQAVLSANPDTPLAQVLPANVIGANPQLRGKTAGQYAQNLSAQFGTSPIDLQPGDPNGQGEDFLRTLPPQRAQLIRSIANGDTAMPSMNRSSAANVLLNEQVQQYDPTASAITLQTRKATRQNFTTGPGGQALAAATTVTGHLSDLLTDIDKLHNSTRPLQNTVAQAVGGQIGNQQQQAAVAAFNNKKVTLAQELTKFYRGTGGAEADVHNFMKQLDATSSPVTLRSTIQSIAEAMQSRMGALQDQYNSGMIGTNVPFPLPPGTADALSRLSDLKTGDTLVNPQTGQRIRLDPKTNTWVEVK